MTLCNACGELVGCGWEFNHHMRVVHGEWAATHAETDDDNANDEPDDNHDDGPNNNDNVIVNPAAFEHSPAIADYLALLERQGTLDLESVLKYTGWGELERDFRLTETLKFLRAVYAKAGASSLHSEGILRYVRGTSRRIAFALPKTLRTCWKRVDRAHRDMSGPLTVVTQTTNIPQAIQDLMADPMDSVTFKFVDPTEALARLLLFSPLAAVRENLALNYEAGDTYDDFCNGDRWKRVQAALPAGASALTCTIFFDGINMDAKGYATSDGAIIVGGNFRKNARESTYAKSSLGTFPTIKFPKVVLDPILGLDYGVITNPFCPPHPPTECSAIAT